MKIPHEPDLALPFNPGCDINGFLLPGNYIWYDGATGKKGWYTIRRREKLCQRLKNEKNAQR